MNVSGPVSVHVTCRLAQPLALNNETEERQMKNDHLQDLGAERDGRTPRGEGTSDAPAADYEVEGGASWELDVLIVEEQADQEAHRTIAHRVPRHRSNEGAFGEGRAGGQLGKRYHLRRPIISTVRVALTPEGIRSALSRQIACRIRACSCDSLPQSSRCSSV